jgi:hypothetical protein
MAGMFHHPSAYKASHNAPYHKKEQQHDWQTLFTRAANVQTKRRTSRPSTRTITNSLKSKLNGQCGSEATPWGGGGGERPSGKRRCSQAEVAQITTAAPIPQPGPSYLEKEARERSAVGPHRQHGLVVPHVTIVCHERAPCPRESPSRNAEQVRQSGIADHEVLAA